MANTPIVAKERFDWAVLDGSNVVDRFSTEAEARAAVGDGGYPDGVTVEFSLDALTDAAVAR